LLDWSKLSAMGCCVPSGFSTRMEAISAAQRRQPSCRIYRSGWGLTVGPRGASCGTAFIGERPSMCQTSSPIHSGTTIATSRSSCLRAMLSRPLLSSGGAILGTFALYYREAVTSYERCAVIENVSHIVGIAIERHMNEEALRAASAEGCHPGSALDWHRTIDHEGCITDSFAASGPSLPPTRCWADV